VKGENLKERKKLLFIITSKHVCALRMTLSPSRKECNYGICAGKTGISLIKFILSSISIYVFK
jgi:hypothetical protein